jgi:CheY-like chemotaxis protein
MKSLCDSEAALPHGQCQMNGADELSSRRQIEHLISGSPVPAIGKAIKCLSPVDFGLSHFRFSENGVLSEICGNKIRIWTWLDTGLDIVVVEDSGLMARMLTLLIERRGWRVIGYATSAKDASVIIRRLQPDLVTLDLSLDDGGSLDLLVEISDDIGIPVLVISGATYEGSPATAEALRLGAELCIDKAAAGQPECLYAALETAIIGQGVEFSAEQKVAQRA